MNDGALGATVVEIANWKKNERGVGGLDPRSSARWFEGWRGVVRIGEESSPVVAARTWLGRVGWRRYGLLGVEEPPRAG